MPSRIVKLDPIVRRLNAVAAESPALKPVTEMYASILPLLRDADLHVEPVRLTRAEARRKLESGLPLLRGMDLVVDPDAARDLIIQLTQALGPSPSQTRPERWLPWGRAARSRATARAEDGKDVARRDAAQAIRRVLQTDKLDVGALLAGEMAGDRAAVEQMASPAELDSDMLWTLASYAVKPALRAWQRQLAPFAEGVTWQKGYCFVCGAAATLGELQGNAQEKHLRCGQCGADWPYILLRCMYCGNDDPKTFSYFFPEGARGRVRVEFCDMCHGYLKVIAAFSPTPAELLAAEDLATLALDYVAEERGYVRAVIHSDQESG